MDKTSLLERTVLAKCTVKHTAKTGTQDCQGDRAGLVGLVEEGQDLVAGLELTDAGTNCLDGTCTIRARDDGVFDTKGVFSLIGQSVG